MGWGGLFHLPSPIFQVRPLGWRLEVRFDAEAQGPVQRPEVQSIPKAAGGFRAAMSEVVAAKEYFI